MKLFSRIALLAVAIGLIVLVAFLVLDPSTTEAPSESDDVAEVTSTPVTVSFSPALSQPELDVLFETRSYDDVTIDEFSVVYGSTPLPGTYKSLTEADIERETLLANEDADLTDQERQDYASETVRYSEIVFSGDVEQAQNLVETSGGTVVTN
ncbi:MAG: hypothetical protein KC925_04240 [Candidatus Doudnabacteria bacterium]|nr:hypothetical protein [Candidatus Doudnabacteria bacterium]MCA9387466.1 hypothetical protein [Candidatus Andersenbacteria bacterium]